MCDAFYDFDADDVLLTLDDDHLTDLDGNLLVRLDDVAAFDIESGDVHIIAPLEPDGEGADPYDPFGGLTFGDGDD